MSVTFRLGKQSDSLFLSSLALRSKAYWPYDQEFIRDCVDDLKVSESRAAGGFIVVAEIDDNIVGFYGFSENSNDPEMTHLFVEPSSVGTGLGFQLWTHALQFAKEKQWTEFKLIADPFAAEKFYLRVGCIKIGEVKSSVRPDRMLPVLSYKI